MDNMPPDDFDIPSEDTPFFMLWGYSPAQLATILATPYDVAIQGVLGALTSATDFTPEDWADLLDRAKALCEATFGPPERPTIGNMRKHQEASDLIVLGMLTYEYGTRPHHQDGEEE